MSNDDLQRFEERLRRLRPAAPPPDLRARVLAPRPGPSWRSVALHAAAVFFLAAVVPANILIEGWRGEREKVAEKRPAVVHPWFKGVQSKEIVRLHFERRRAQSRG